MFATPMLDLLIALVSVKCTHRDLSLQTFRQRFTNAVTHRPYKVLLLSVFVTFTAILLLMILLATEHTLIIFRHGKVYRMRSVYFRRIGYLCTKAQSVNVSHLRSYFATNILLLFFFSFVKEDCASLSQVPRIWFSFLTSDT